MDKFLKLVSTSVFCRGEADTIKRLKAFRLVLSQYALGQTVTPIPFCKADKDGFPKAIRFLKPDRNDVYSVRYSFSVMRIIESFRCKPEYSVSTIIEESTADESLLNEICDYIRNWSFLRHIPKLGQTQLVLSNRAGPNGPASVSAIRDLTSLREEQNSELYSGIMELLSLTGSHLIPESYKSHEGVFQHSKLVLLSDKACKTRVIAIADWWSNTALSSIHVSTMAALRKLPSDVTYRQSDIPKLVKSLGNHLYSSDMTAFTDRFPRKLETTLLEAAYGQRVSELWELIVSGRTFNHPMGGVKYACGNPMGLLSSWPVSTLTHHAVKQWCAHKCGANKYKYLILGDDTLDSRKDVYDLYTQTIEELGVSISPSKCTQSEVGNAEFAKRYFLNHVDVTGLPVHILEEIMNKPEQFLELVRLCIERGYEISFLGPSLDSLIRSHKNEKQLADILSLPLSVTGQPPVLEGRVGSHASLLREKEQEGSLEDLVRIARDKVFWETVSKIDNPGVPKNVCQVPIEPNHPLVFALSEQLLDYLLEDEDGFGLYNRWMSGEYREMANLPFLDTYRYYNKGHKATKCKFDVLNTLLKLSAGDCNIPLYKPNKLEDYDLYDLVFIPMQEALIK
jgi:hypothetical protein